MPWLGAGGWLGASTHSDALPHTRCRQSPERLFLLGLCKGLAWHARTHAAPGARGPCTDPSARSRRAPTSRAGGGSCLLGWPPQPAGQATGWAGLPSLGRGCASAVPSPQRATPPLHLESTTHQHLHMAGAAGAWYAAACCLRRGPQGAQPSGTITGCSPSRCDARCRWRPTRRGGPGGWRAAHRLWQREARWASRGCARQGGGLGPQGPAHTSLRRALRRANRAASNAALPSRCARRRFAWRSSDTAELAPPPPRPCWPRQQSARVQLVMSSSSTRCSSSR